MFSPLNDLAVTDWFRRLDAAWKRMPADEQTRQREEVRQHLESLATSNTAQGQPLDAAWSAALAQFGDPTHLGRKIYREWKQSRTGFRRDMAAIFFGLGLILGLGIIETIPLFLWATTFYGGTFFVYVVLGRKYPMQAIKGAFYITIVCNIWNLLGAALVAVLHVEVPQLSVMAFQPVFLLAMLSSLLFHPTLAYLASVTKRGWYKPTWDDFKLTLPKRRSAA